MSHTATQEKPSASAKPAPAEVALCGHAINGARGVKPCVKPAGHDTDEALIKAHGKGHASRIQNKVTRKPVSRKVLATLETVPADVTVEYGAGRGRNAEERSEEQKLVDAHVKSAHEAWIAAGRPKLGFNDSIKQGLASRYQLAPEDEDGIRAMLRSAGRVHNVSVRIAPLKRHENGKSMLYWTVADVTPHKTDTVPAANGAPEK